MSDTPPGQAPGQTPDQTPDQTPTPVFQPEAAHHQRPKIRALRGFPVKVGDQQGLGLADARQVSERVIVVAPQVQILLPLMDGSRTVDEIVEQIGRGLTREIVENLVAQLDDAGLMFGPKFDAISDKMKADFDKSPTLPPASTAAFADAVGAQGAPEDATDEQKSARGKVRMKEIFDAWIAQALKDVSNPSVDALPLAVIAPHIDYPRGWLNYAHTWGRLRVCDRPDRVIILGTNHFGEGSGVVGCDKGYETPFGVCEVDPAVVEALRGKLGDSLYTHRYDHEREHSIELQIPWIQHCFGADDSGRFVKVFGALIHDPVQNNGLSYDGAGVALDPFVDALRSVIAELPGRTLVVSSADLSHVGPAFGDQQTLAGEEEAPTEFRNRVFQHDQDMLKFIRENKPDELITAMTWQQNPTRWCSIGNISAALLATRPTTVDVLSYAAAMDPQGHGMVSSMSAIMS